MKWISAIHSLSELQDWKRFAGKQVPAEVLLGHEALSRLGSFSTESLNDALLELKNFDIRPVLEWDILMTESELTQSIQLIESWSTEFRNRFSAVRVQDPGALQYVLEHWKGIDIQLNLETGNHNLEAIQSWISTGQQSTGENRIVRIILSIELPIERLRTYAAELSKSWPAGSIEILGLGPILLLYTPRPLLSSRGESQNQKTKPQKTKPQKTTRAIASSDEGVHKGFRVLENRHGTFLFHEKDYCLLEHTDDLARAGVGVMRLDFRLEQDPSACIAALSDMSRYPNKTTRCFYQANATDVLFKKLKNTRVQRTDYQYVGEVVESCKGSHTIIQVLGKNQKITIGQSLKFIAPDGHVKDQMIDSLVNLDGDVIAEAIMGDYAVTPYIKFATPRTAVYCA